MKANRYLLFGQYERPSAFKHFINVLWGKPKRTKSVAEKKMGTERAISGLGVLWEALLDC